MKKHDLYTAFTKTMTPGIFMALCVCLFNIPATGQVLPSREYKVKAAFLFNFTRFVEWPATAFDSTDAPFVIALLGEDPFGTLIDDLVKGEKVKGHPITVSRYKQASDLGSCHMVFISGKEALLIKELIVSIPPRVLTVGDHPDFNLNGGMIRLTTEEQKIKLIIDPVVIKAAELTVSSKLLNVAEIYNR